MSNTGRNRNRVWNLRRFGITSVPLLGHYKYVQAATALDVHRHRGAVEICFLVGGQQTYYVDRRRFRLRGGDIFMTLPDEEHSTGGEPEEKGQLYWMWLLNPSMTGGSLFGLPRKDSRVLWQSLIQAPSRRHFSGNAEIKFRFDEVARLIQSPISGLRRIEVCNDLIALLLQVIACRNASPQRDVQPFQTVLAHVESHLDEPHELGIEKLARIAGLSCSRFKASFKRETGMPPAEYALRRRIDEAERRLTRGDLTVTQVAFDLGFSSSQYFATVYRRFTHRTPHEAKSQVASA